MEIKYTSNWFHGTLGHLKLENCEIFLAKRTWYKLQVHAAVKGNDIQKCFKKL